MYLTFVGYWLYGNNPTRFSTIGLYVVCILPTRFVRPRATVIAYTIIGNTTLTAVLFDVKHVFILQPNNCIVYYATRRAGEHIMDE